MNKREKRKQQKELHDVARTIRTVVDEMDTSPFVSVYQERPNTFVLIRVHLDYSDSFQGVDVEGFGFSKVMRPDKWNSGVGYGIAYERAVFNLCKNIVRRLGITPSNVDQWVGQLSSRLILNYVPFLLKEMV